MFTSLALNTVVLPFAFGLALALAGRFGSKGMLGAAVLVLSAAYVLLEGLPGFPPVASKQKVLYLFALAAGVALVSRFIPPRAKVLLVALTGGFLLGAAVWLGINKFASGGVMASAFVLAPIVAGAFGSTGLHRSARQPLLWPLALVCLAIGAALLSAFGAFVGFAQVAGACAALIGAYALVRYILLLAGREAGFAILSTTATTFLTVSVTSVVILIALFAPTISQAGVVVVSLTLILPVFVPDFASQPRALVPVLQGLILALPTIGAVPLALMIHQP